MNIYLYEDENYDKYYENLLISNLKYVYEITKLTNKNDTIHINKIFDTNIIIKFNDISLCNNNENICIINIIYKKDLFLINFEPNCNYYVIYINNDTYVNNIFTYNFIKEEINNKLNLILNKIFFNWFNYKNIFSLKIYKNIKKNNNNDSSEVININSNDLFNKEKHKRSYTLVTYLNKYGISDIIYNAYFDDNFNNFTWVKNIDFPIFGFNRHYTNNKCILFQLKDYQDKNTLLSYNKILDIPFNLKIKDKCVGYFSQMGSYTIDDNWYQYELLDIKDETYDINFLCLSNFDRFSFCYKYINNDLFELGLINNNKSKIVSTHFPWLIKQKKDLNYLNKYMFHIYLNGNDWGTSLFWQLLCFNVVFIPFPFEYQSIFMYGLQPYTHFVPISNKLFDIEEKLKFMMNNIELCEKIATNAHNYIKIFIENDCEFLDLISSETIKIYNTFISMNNN